MSPNIANAVTCSVVGHTFGSLVDEHGTRLCVECGAAESRADDEDEDEDTDPNRTDLYTENGGEAGA